MIDAAIADQCIDRHLVGMRNGGVKDRKQPIFQ
jgi:hypothetical protein